jgi:Aldehyde dehydrogenase family
MPAIAMGNCVVAVPSASHPLSATDFYSVLDTSDVPAGVVNIVTGEANALTKTLAEHDGVDAVWYVGDTDGAAQVEGAFRRRKESLGEEGASFRHQNNPPLKDLMLCVSERPRRLGSDARTPKLSQRALARPLPPHAPGDRVRL